MRILLVFVMLLISLKAIAPESLEINVFASKPADLYSKLINAIIQVESGGNTLAYNPFENAYGPMQIRPIRLLDFNMRTGKKYKMTDCYSLEVSKEIFLYYTRDIALPDYELLAKRWNGSGRKTIDYWLKVRKYL